MFFEVKFQAVLQIIQIIYHSLESVVTTATK